VRVARRFHFRLETVLRVRTLREREARRRVGAKLAEIAGVDRINTQTLAEISTRQAQLLDRQRSSTLDPRALASERAWVNFLRRGVAERQTLKAALRRELDALRDELRAARSQMKAIEKLRERRHTEWKRDVAVREQTESDELARQLLRFAAGSGVPR
jgi:flagellar export protein FliJ